MIATKKKLALLVVMLAVVLGIPAAPATAQQYQYGPQGDLIATGVLGESYTVGQDPGRIYPITDEASGAAYELQSGYVDLESYVGRKVTVYGTPTPGIGTPPRYDVIRVEPADDAPPPVEEVSATGVIEPGACAAVVGDAPPCQYGITDEATGQFYGLVSDSVDLGAYAAGDGRRVTVHGAVLETVVATEYPVLNVARVEPLDGQGGEGDSVAVAFELAVEGTPPADATFFASLGYEPAYFPLTDPDGDGLYSAAAPEGYVAAGDVLPARILQGTGTRPSQVSGTAPGDPVSTIKDFGEVRFDEDQTLSAEVSFDGEEPPPPEEEVTTTGIVEALEAEPVVVDGVEICGLSTHAITDEATGRRYDLTSESVDLDEYVGKRVAATGAPLPSPAIEEAEPCPDLDVTRVEILDGGSEPPPPGRSATLAFKLAVECEPPEGATFFGNVLTGEGGPGIFAELLDPDGDGLYVGVATLPDRFAPGPAPEGTPPVSLRVQVVQGTGTRSVPAGTLPGEPTSVVKDFGVVPMEAGNVFPADASFCDGNEPVVSGDTNGDKVPGSGGSDDGAFGGIKTLPATGGALLVAALAGLALVAAGLLVRGKFTP